MCGIAGAFTTNKIPPQANLELVQAILTDQFSRGPDCQQYELISGENYSICLGANRLAIQDLHTNANQPMRDSTQRYCLVYNGEVYNFLELRKELQQLGYLFQTHGDTEVVLYSLIAWGLAAIQKFNGMFALAFFDRNTAELWLIRDRFGVKPLYYYIQKGEIYFASSSRILANQFKLTPNYNYLAHGVQFGIYETGTDETMFSELYSIKPAHSLLINTHLLNENIFQQQCYYNLTENSRLKLNTISSTTEKQLIETTQQLLEDAIKLRLRSDVKVGLSLSGGLDSATLLALLHPHHSSIQAFHYGEPKTASTEAPLVAELNKKYPIQIHYVWPSTREVIASFDTLLKNQQAPFASFSIIAQHCIYKAAHQQGFKVMLVGQGGDELFLGYRKFFLFYLNELKRSHKYFDLFTTLLSLAPTVFAETHRLKLFWQERHKYTRKQGITTALGLPTLNNVTMGLNRNSTVQNRQILDINQFSLPTLLRYDDHNSMGHSIETRLPYLDYRLVEFATALPTALKIRNGYGKWILRQVTKDKIPDNIRLARYKRGFDGFNENWFKKGLGHLIRERIGDNRSKFSDILPNNLKISEYFSDINLINNGTSFREAMTLAWLAEVLA